jgi:beta-phosphoglucomutase-like phosphatase (HAD superfamily)
MKPEIIIYDFDGVIANSVNIKTEAFVELYKNYDIDIQNAIKNDF